MEVVVVRMAKVALPGLFIAGTDRYDMVYLEREVAHAVLRRRMSAVRAAMTVTFAS